MKKKDFIKLFENLDDEAKVVITSTIQFDGYNVITEDIEVIEDYVDDEKIIVIQEKDI